MTGKPGSRMVLCVTAAWIVSLLVAGCAVEVPKSALQGFRLTPPESSQPDDTTDQRLIERRAGS